MVQISRRALLNYFKMIIENRFYANITYFLKNGVSRTPMWTRDFLTPYYNIQIINRRLQHEGLDVVIDVIITYKSLTGDYSHGSVEIGGHAYYNIQIINRRLQLATLKRMTMADYNIQIINRRLQPCVCNVCVNVYYNIQIINRRLQLERI